MCASVINCKSIIFSNKTNNKKDTVEIVHHIAVILGIMIFSTLFQISSARAQNFPSVIELSALDGTDGFNLELVGAGLTIFSQVANIGDINGDGISDIAIGVDAANAAFVIFGKSGGFTTPIDLAALNGSDGFRINGPNGHNGGVGSSVNAAGDFNGDGIDDIIIGAPATRFGVNPVLVGVGAAYVVFGHIGAFDAVFDVSNLNGTNGFAINGEAKRMSTGFSVDGIGDFNGDEIDDVIIGSFVGATNDVSFEEGVAYILYGNTTPFPAMFELFTIDGANGFTLHGEVKGDRAGISVAGAGDINKDGLMDVIIASNQADLAGINGTDTGYVVFGSNNNFPADFELSSLNGANGFALNGIAAGGGVGNAVSGLGDINDDGNDDLIISAPNAAPGGRANAGISYVIFGKNSAFPAAFELSALDGTNGFAINGITASDQAGFRVSGAGDINGDNMNDLIIGAPFADPGGRDSAGTGYVVFGKNTPFSATFELASLNGLNGFAMNGVNAFDTAGISISSAGDINNDGVDDVIVGGLKDLKASVVFGIASTPPASTTLFSSVLPAARAGFVGGPAITVFASVVNAGSKKGKTCTISIPGTSSVTLSYQQTDAANAPMGAADAVFTLEAGQTRSFILAFTPVSTSVGEEVFPKVKCNNGEVAVISGVNTVFLSIDSTAGLDILSIGATPSGNGIITVPLDSISLMTAAAINIGEGDNPGSKDATITVSVDTGAANLALFLQVCELNSASQCITPLGPEVTTTIGDAAKFFALFVSDQNSGGIVLDPANARVFLRFKDAAGITRSVTSAAVIVQ